MNLLSKDVNSLIDLGLRNTEAKVFITLSEMGTAKASAIAKASKIARPDVYRALSNLQELGLVQKIVSIPCLFQSIDVENGVGILLEKKAMQFAKLELRSTTLIRRLKSTVNRLNHIPNPHQFVLVPSRTALINALRQSIKHTQKSIDVFTSFKRMNFACHILSEELEKAWKRGIKGRAILEEPNKTTMDFQKTCWRKPHAKIKYIQSFPKTIMSIYDSKEAFIIVENEANLSESSALWTNNFSVVSLAQYGFNSCWNKTKE